MSTCMIAVIQRKAEVEFGTALICLGDFKEPLSVKVASTQIQRQQGFIGHDEPGFDSGMLFRYSHETAYKTGFWMFNVPFALEVAFVSAAGRGVDIQEMAPCIGVPARECQTYQASRPYQAALEVRPGVLRERGVTLGSLVREAVGGACKEP